jgi:hypothetical protein
MAASPFLRISAIPVTIALAGMLAWAYAYSRSPARIMSASYQEVFNAERDPRLPAQIPWPSVDVFDRPYVNGSTVVVLCGQCASCSTKAFDPIGIATGLPSHKSLILIYESSPKQIRSEFEGRRRPNNLFFFADPQSHLSSLLNGGFPYRHANGRIDNGILAIDRLQRNGEQETEFRR